MNPSKDVLGVTHKGWTLLALMRSLFAPPVGPSPTLPAEIDVWQVKLGSTLRDHPRNRVIMAYRLQKKRGWEDVSFYFYSLKFQMVLT